MTKFYIRSPFTCNLTVGVCQSCYGWNLGNGRMIELGENVGIIAAQSIGEPCTQLTMRTFHTGGVFSGSSTQTINALHNGVIYYNTSHGKLIKTKYNEEAFFCLKDKSLMIIKNQINKSIINIPKFSTIFVRNKSKVFCKQALGEISNWKELLRNTKLSKKHNFITEIRTNITGLVYTPNSLHELNVVWIISGNILLFCGFSKNFELRNMHNLTTFLRSEEYFNSNLSSSRNKTNSLFKINFNLKNSQKLLYFVRKNEVKIIKNSIYYNVCEVLLYEKKLLVNKKKTKLCVRILQENLKVNCFFNSRFADVDILNFRILEKRKSSFVIVKSNKYQVPSDLVMKKRIKYLIKKQKPIFFSISSKEKTRDIVEGLPKIEQMLEATRNSVTDNMHFKLQRQFIKFRKSYSYKVATQKSMLKIRSLFLSKIQKVYYNQSVLISDKHFELVIKQITSKVIVKNVGGSRFINGEIIDFNRVLKINLNLNDKVEYEPVLVGISRLPSLNFGFLSAASFQETTKIITKAAIEGKIDWLLGLKENVLLGNLIPTGTGVH